MSVQWIDGPALAAWLAEEHGITPAAAKPLGYERRIREWQEGAKAKLETADRVLTKCDIHLDELPDRLRPTLPRNPHARENHITVPPKLTDDQLRALHKLNTRGGFSIRELGRRVQKQAGFKSEASAASSIRRGFRRLFLEAAEYRNGYGLAEMPRRCEKVKPNGERCSSYPMRGEAVCFPHHPDNREWARANAIRARRSQLEKAAA